MFYFFWTITWDFRYASAAWHIRNMPYIVLKIKKSIEYIIGYAMFQNAIYTPTPKKLTIHV